MGIACIISAFCDFFLYYDTTRYVRIKGRCIGLYYRLLQWTIIVYIYGYVILYTKGYQNSDGVTGSATTTLHGVAFTDYSDEYPGISGPLVWDVGDYVVPPLDNNAFFVMTDVLITPLQLQGVCPEDPGINGALCDTDNDCPANTSIPMGNGWRTGKCVANNATGSPVNTCQIRAWCPVQNSRQKEPPEPVLLDSQNFTVFIKNDVEFPDFGVKRNNIFSIENDTELTKCRNNGSDSSCPIFVIGDIVKYAKQNDYAALAKSGGIIKIIITWDCDLDLSEEECKPAYSFRRLDKFANYTSANGFHLRYGKYFGLENKTMARQFIKATGIRFIISIEGQAGKFDLVPLMLNVASGFALLAIAGILCDYFVLHILKGKHTITEMKYLHAATGDAYVDLESNETTYASTETASLRSRELASLNRD